MTVPRIYFGVRPYIFFVRSAEVVRRKIAASASGIGQKSLQVSRVIYQEEKLNVRQGT